MFARHIQSETDVQVSDFRTSFEQRGFVGPISIFDLRECRRLRNLLKFLPTPAIWSKGHAASSRLMYILASRRSILDRVALLLGNDFMLWGARVAHRKPGQAHPWHTDIETATEHARSVTVWIGLKNTNQQSSLQLIAGSHRFGHCFQESAKEKGKTRGQATTQDVIHWAKQRNPSSQLSQPEITDGHALFFDGRIWHGSINTNSHDTRTALILNYATPDTRIRMPDFSVLDWPFRFIDTPHPPCIMVRGSSPEGVNELVTEPVQFDLSVQSRVPVVAETLHLPFQEDKQKGFKPHPIFRGSTKTMTSLGCHVSILSSGIMPHEPHVHDHEELLIMLSGETELVIVDDKPSPTETRHKVRQGFFAYYPAHQRHTIQNVGDRPATYLMFKWYAETDPNEQPPLQTSIFNYEDIAGGPPTQSTDGWDRWRLFAGPTKYLRKLSCHLSTLEPNAGYMPHVDAYDVALLVVGGTVETVGKTIGPTGVIFYPAGEPHGIKNVGHDRASYLVFEFHDQESRPPSLSLIHHLFDLLPRPVQVIVKKSLSLVRRARSKFRSS